MIFKHNQCNWLWHQHRVTVDIYLSTRWSSTATHWPVCPRRKGCLWPWPSKLITFKTPGLEAALHYSGHDVDNRWWTYAVRAAKHSHCWVHTIAA